MEAPLIAWPVKASADFEAFSFCENCLKIRPFHPEPTQHKQKQRHALAHPAASTTAETTSQTAEAASQEVESVAAAAAAASEGEEEEAGICVRETEGREALWFCSPRCYHQACGGTKTADVEGGSPAAAADAVAARSKRNLDGSLMSPANSSNSNSSNKWEEQREFGWMEFLSLGALLRLRHYDQQQRVTTGSGASVKGGEMREMREVDAERKTESSALNNETAKRSQEKMQAAEKDTNTENPIGVEALGPTTVTLRNAFNLDLEAAYAEACRPFLRLSAAAAADVFCTFDIQRAQQLLQQQLGGALETALGPDAAGALLGENALAFFYGGLMRNAQALLVWGSTTAGCLMILRGAGVYVLQACCNHSCSPNCTVQNDHDAFIALKADKDIQVGEEITISYVPLDLAAPERQQLLNSYQFTCSCVRCADEAQKQQQHQQQQQEQPMQMQLQ
ncbi:uncharacterized protein EMH_0051300 [Eimeria mitis]|uniref:SET domain-containing protein n=1 Tax=Eimeria mitis TaxID=44415 RepID=U6KGU4_9EIME|nr:uncharacterized protein EMH_0051300 [Eimeria mitis]CDJ35996.1 hypothetical protein, conserved [Eimeria mitis]